MFIIIYYTIIVNIIMSTVVYTRCLVFRRGRPCMCHIIVCALYTRCISNIYSSIPTFIFHFNFVQIQYKIYSRRSSLNYSYMYIKKVKILYNIIVVRRTRAPHKFPFDYAYCFSIFLHSNPLF